MTLKSKILSGYGTAFLLMVMVIVWAVVNLVSLGKASDAILRENYRSIRAAGNMMDALERQDGGILLLLSGETEKGVSQFRENEAVFLEWLARAKDNITIEGEDELVNSIGADFAEYREQFSRLTDFHSKSSPPSKSNARLYTESVYAVFARVRETCIQLRDLNEKTMYEASVRASQVSKWAIWSTVLVAASALVVGLTLNLLLAERIIRPLRRFMEASRKISSGDYGVQVSVKTGDELGLLAGEFNRMASQLGHYHEMNIDQIISEKNKGEAVLSSIEDGLVVFDTNLKVSAINPAARRMLDLEFTECTTLGCADMLPGSSICDMIRKTMETGAQPSVPEEQRILTFSQGEHTHHYLFSVTAIRGRDRSLTGTVLLLRDVTRLREVERLKSEFIMAASHELRTPLTSMGMSIDLLLERGTSGLAQKDIELLQAAHEEVHRMKALVNDLLDLSKIEAGKIELEFSRVSVRTLFERVRTLFGSQLEAKNVQLELELSDDLPEIRADANKITWVLTNLVSNALRYVSDRGHIQLLASQTGPYVHISVRDDGPGIPLEYQTRIFRKFVQVEGRETDGSGLGLAICKEIVRANGGTIWVESVPGQGSTFTFTVPVIG